MDLRDLFEQHVEHTTELTAEFAKSHRLSNGSYDNPKLSTAFLWFCAGFKAHPNDKLRVLGYISHKGALKAASGKAAFFNANQTDAKCVCVWAALTDAQKTGE